MAAGMTQVELGRHFGHRNGASVFKYERGMHGLSAREYIIASDVLRRSLDWMIAGIERDSDAGLSAEGLSALLIYLRVTPAERKVLDAYLQQNPHHRTRAAVTAWLDCYRTYATPRRSRVRAVVAAGNAAVAAAARQDAIAETGSAAQAAPGDVRKRIQARRRNAEL